MREDRSERIKGSIAKILTGPENSSTLNMDREEDSGDILAEAETLAGLAFEQRETENFWANYLLDVDETEPRDEQELLFTRTETEKNRLSEEKRRVAQEKADEKAARRAERVARCGEYRLQTNPENRTLRPVRYACGHSECVPCGRLQVQAEYQRACRAFDEWGELTFLLAQPADRGKINKFVKSQTLGEVRWLPQADGSLLAYTSVDLEDMLKAGMPGDYRHIDHYKQLERIAWNRIGRTPAGRRKTGTLGTEPAGAGQAEQTSTEPTAKVKVPEFRLEGLSARAARKAYREALRKTQYLNPLEEDGEFTARGYKRAMFAWLDALTVQMERAGGTLTITRWIIRAVRINRINWLYTDYSPSELHAALPNEVFSKPKKGRKPLPI